MSAFAQLYNLGAQLSVIFVFVPLGLAMPRTFQFQYNLLVCLFAVIIYFVFFAEDSNVLGIMTGRCPDALTD